MPTAQWTFFGWITLIQAILCHTEDYRDDKNPAYTIVDKFLINMEKEPPEEANRIERRLQGGFDSEEDSDSNDAGDDADDGRI